MNHLGIIWFRRDLRLADNRALAVVAESGRPFAAVYLPEWDARPRGQAAQSWLQASLESIDIELRGHGGELWRLEGRPEDVLPVLGRVLSAEIVAWNRLVEPESIALDERVARALERGGSRALRFDSDVVFELTDRLARSGRPFRQFAPFWSSCLSQLEPVPPEPVPHRLNPIGAAAKRAALAAAGLRLVDAQPPAQAPSSIKPRAGRPAVARREGVWVGAAGWEPGRAGALRRLVRFLDEDLPAYACERDLVARDGTSRLSPHLHFGEIGPREVWQAVRARQRDASGAESGYKGVGRRDCVGGRAACDAALSGGAQAFLRQLGWREFSRYLLFHFPQTDREPFRPEYADFPWLDDVDGEEAWKAGRTGYPMVDAGMRQLLAEGWMHNRARLVAASFLAKHLLVPWQSGARWFWERLVDADAANNSVNWQWVAGSGPDAAPYFRIFNPVLQGRRFDPDGTYVRRWVPELAGLPDVWVHRPWLAPGSVLRDASVELGADYAWPVVDHDQARVRALAAFDRMRYSADGRSGKGS
jgi:deoxyribodipyrimidine photo-lyase